MYVLLKHRNGRRNIEIFVVTKKYLVTYRRSGFGELAIPFEQTSLSQETGSSIVDFHLVCRSTFCCNNVETKFLNNYINFRIRTYGALLEKVRRFFLPSF